MSNSPALTSQKTFFTFDRLLAGASVFWLVLVLFAFPSIPAALWVTFALLAVDAVVALAVLIRGKRIAVLLGLAQLGLFTVAHYQVNCSLGSQHYTFDRTPGPFDWLALSGAHVLRAVDLLDIIEEYGIDLQNVKHASTLSGCMVVAMHLTVDVFLIGLALRWGKKLWQRYREARKKKADTSEEVARRKEHAERLARWLGRAKGGCLGICIALYFGYAYSQGWRAADWLLWPLDSIMRLVDVGDMMQVFSWRLHGIGESFWLSTLAVSFRLFAGFFIAELLNYAQLGVLREWNVQTTEELVENLKKPNQVVRLVAAKTLGRLGHDAASAVPALIQTLTDNDEDVREAAAEAMGKIDANWAKSPQAASAVPALILALAHKDGHVCQAAAKALGEIGPQARSAFGHLARKLRDKDKRVRLAAASALEKISPESLPRQERPSKTP